MVDSVGLIGLGIMGSAIGKNLLSAGYRVIGYDLSQPAMREFVVAGGTAGSSPRGVMEGATTVLLCLPSREALSQVLEGENGILESGCQGRVVVEMSTLDLEAKRAAFEALSTRGITLLDCPISGTGVQAVVKDLVLFCSGDASSFERCRELFSIFSRRQIFLGKFGNGSTLKYIANHLVTIHNVAAGEALAFASKCGMDRHMVFDALVESAACSKMLQVRGPLMVTGEYVPASATIKMQLKDIRIIAGHAADVGMPLPLFSAAIQHYVGAVSCGLSNNDTASVCQISERMAGLNLMNVLGAQTG